MLGIGITTISAVVFLIYVIMFALLSKSNVKETAYFEGDKLLEEWKTVENEGCYEEIDAFREEKEELLEETNPEVPSLTEDFEKDEDYSHIFESTLQQGYENGFKINLDTREDALKSVEKIDELLAKVTSSMSSIGATMNRLESTYTLNEVNIMNLSTVKSLIVDADISSEVFRCTQAQILQEVSSSLLAQVNKGSKGFLQKLLGLGIN
jgi:flagellin-like hook-associated protein FlgL